MLPPALVPDLQAAVDRQLESLRLLAARLPPEAGGWRPVLPAPARPARTTGELLAHLLDAATGVGAVLRALQPERLAWLDGLRREAPEEPLTPEGFVTGLEGVRRALDRAFDGLDTADLSRRVPSRLLGGTASGLSLLLGNLDHLACHRHELFQHLRAQGVEVGTAELYALSAGGRDET